MKKHYTSCQIQYNSLLKALSIQDSILLCRVKLTTSCHAMQPKRKGCSVVGLMLPCCTVQDCPSTLRPYLEGQILIEAHGKCAVTLPYFALLTNTTSLKATAFRNLVHLVMQHFIEMCTKGNSGRLLWKL